VTGISERQGLALATLRTEAMTQNLSIMETAHKQITNRMAKKVKDLYLPDFAFLAGWGGKRRDAARQKRNPACALRIRG